MKHSIKIVALGFLLFFGISCSTTRHFNIEVMEPAAITVPATVKNVLVVNNAVPQHKFSELSFNLDGKHTVGWQMDLDSINWLATYTLANILSDAEFFSAVDVYTQEIREDDDFLEIKNLQKDVRTDFFDSLDYDMLISLDRLLFSAENEVTFEPRITYDTGKTIYFSAPIVGLINCNTYLKGRETPSPAFGIKDTLMFEFFMREDSTLGYWTHPEVIIKVLTTVLSGRAANKYAPNWETTERLIFSGKGSRMRKANSYSSSENWQKATEIWNMELEKNPIGKTKAEILSNLAVGSEMMDNLAEALQYAEKSQNTFKEILKNETDKNLVWIDFYIKYLEKRIIDNRILDIQLGKENSP